MVMLVARVQAFQIPHTRHHHPVYVRYRLEQLEQERQKEQQSNQSGYNNHRRSRGSGCSSDLVEARGTAVATGETDFSSTSMITNDDASSSPSSLFVQEQEGTSKQYYYSPQEHQQKVLPIPADSSASISTPISYDEETGMVQTTVRAIVQHPVATLVDSHLVGLSSTLVISLGAIHELVDCIEMEWAHHATSSTEGLAILSLGHFLHYGRETIRQLGEMANEDEARTTSE
jgi:hypothetical protein